MFNKLIVGLVMVLIACTVAARPEYFSATTADGLQLIQQSQVRAFYMKPGASLREYKKIVLMEPHVSFARNWQQRVNEGDSGGYQVTDGQMQEIRDTVAKEFAREMTRVLRADGRQIVASGGAGVLVLRPTIADLEMTVPDQGIPGTNRRFVASAVNMVLYLDLYDGRTGDIIARIIDPEATDDNGMAEVADRVTITAEFDGIVKHWAQVLNAHLAHTTRNY